MTLIGAILKKAQSKESVKKYSSPPPEVDESVLRKKKRRVQRNKYEHIHAMVDTSPPWYDPKRALLSLPVWKNRLDDLYLDNARLLIAIMTAYMNGGKVDNHWTIQHYFSKQYYDNRMQMLKRIMRDNQDLYRIIRNSRPRVVSTADLQRDWVRNKQEITQKARLKFVLFSPAPVDIMEDCAFKAPDGFIRPRVYITLRMQGVTLGTLIVELFTDVSPQTCQLFMELCDGVAGYGYVGTQFFRKVPYLFWSGGDVVHDNGFGCFAQRGRQRPIGAENYHFSHSMPGLLSMRVTKHDEVCGSFNIIFKPLPQFDLQNVVFGRIVRPCATYDVIRTLGLPLSTQPIIEIADIKRRHENRWVHGTENSYIKKYSPRFVFK